MPKNSPMALEASRDKPLTVSAEELAKRFTELVAKCDHDDRFSSKSKTMLAHPGFQEIVAMGEKAVPLLLASLENEPSHWFLALQKITGANPPIAKESIGRIDEISAAWIAWGRAQGYRW